MEKITFDLLMIHALTLRQGGMLLPGMIMKFRVSTDERKEIVNSLMDMSIDYDYVKCEHNKRDPSFYRFQVLGIKFEIQ